MRFRYICSVIALWAGCVHAVMASPTSDEFVPCHQMASEVLLVCLNDHAGQTGDTCWDAARRNNETCYDRVFARHRPDKARIEAEKRALEQSRQEKQNVQPE